MRYKLNTLIHPSICFPIKKLLFVFILLILLPFTGCKSVVKETVVEKPEKVILYLEYKDGEQIWSPEKSNNLQPRYEGEAINGIPNGIGTFYLLDGGIYEGEYKDGRYHGQGTINRYDGSKYVGEFRYGELNGQGTLTFPDGKKHVGEFRKNNIWNITEYDKEGNTVKKWVNGVMNWGVLFIRKVNGKLEWFENGDKDEDGKYVGEIKNGKPNGKGKESFPGGAMYEGDYKDGKPNGIGTESFSNGSKYVGKYKDGNFYGQGTLTFLIGLKMIGEWRKNPWNIKVYDINGNITGKFVNGVIQQGPP